MTATANALKEYALIPNDDQRIMVEIPRKMGGVCRVPSYEDGLSAYEERDGKLYVRELQSIVCPGDTPHVSERYITHTHTLEMENLRIVDDSLQANMNKHLGH